MDIIQRTLRIDGIIIRLMNNFIHRETVEVQYKQQQYKQYRWKQVKTGENSSTRKNDEVAGYV